MVDPLLDEGNEPPRGDLSPDTVVEITSTHDASGALVVTVAGEVDLATSPLFRDQILEMLNRTPQVVVISMDQVSFLDSTGLGALIAIHRRAREVGVKVRLTSPARGPSKTLHVTGLDAEFAIYPTIADALAG